ncbi:MAG: MDR family oxidoreductase [Actinomycetota bacterium]
MTYRALLLDRADDGSVTASMTDLDDGRLPDGELTIDVDYSSLNYKDGMILQGLGGLVRNYPHVPGVDLSGVVAASDSPDFEPGDRVVCTGWRMGEVHWGGYAQRARLPATWPTKLPDHVSSRQAMAIGTAGFTAMQAVLALEDHGLTAGSGQQILVTGASGGVGSSALLWGNALGHRMVASTGRMENADELRALGASDVVDRTELAEAPGRPLLSERWHGCIDAVGGDTLAHVLAEMAAGGSVAACGLAGGNALSITVIPFLLRGVNLLGIDSVMATPATRQRVNARLAEALMDEGLRALLDDMTTEVALKDVPGLAPQILAGQVKGRVVVRCR